MKRAPVLLVAMLLVGLLQTEGGAREGTPTAKGQLVRQKMAMLQKLIAAVPDASAGGDGEYQRLVAEARGRFEKAQAALQAGDEAAAETEIDQAVRYVARARQAVGRAGPAATDLEQFKELAQSMDSLYASFQQRAQSLARDDPRREAANKVLQQVGVMMGQARRLSGERLQAATALMLAAQRALQAGYTQMLGKEVDYTPSFASPAEEYQYELAQNRSYQELIPIALEQLRPSLEARRAVEELLKYNLTAVESAKARAGRKQYPEAIRQLQDGTQSLKRALLAAGLMVPQ